MAVRSALLVAIFVSSCFAQEFIDMRQAWQKLDAEPAVLVNSQGLAQHDLSIRGGSYSASGMSINGLRLKSPYSAHWNSELPVLGNLSAVPTTATGMQNLSGHLTGTADFSTQPLTETRNAYAGIGTEEHYAGGLYSSSEMLGGYFDYEKALNTDGADNDMERAGGGAVLQIPAEEWRIDLITAGQSKEFDTDGYYGTAGDSSQLLDDSLFFAGAVRGDLDDAYLRASALYRDIRSQTLAPSAAAYTNVYSRSFAAAVEGRTMEIQHIALNLRGDFEYDRVSGDLTNDDRARGSFLILPEARFERFTVKAGLNSVFQTAESAEFLPALGLDWFLTDNGMIYLSYTETEQQPDYQTLESNPALQQQHSCNSEFGFRQYLSESSDWHIGVFHRTLENASDWIGGAATDLGRLQIAGLDTSISYYPTENLELKAFYQWVYKDNKIDGGLYETDYPEHMLNLSADWAFLEQFAVQFSQTARLQAENPARTSGDFGTLATLGLHYQPVCAKNVCISVRVDNLWGSNFQSLPGLAPRPATVFTGLAVNW